MALAKWNYPLMGISSAQRAVDDLLGNFFNPMPWRVPATETVPIMDVYNEDDKNLVTELHLPGYGPEDVEISVEDNVLEIRGEKPMEEDRGGSSRNYLVRQSSGSFFRTVALPNKIDADKIEAEFEDGILRITAPLKHATKSRRIAVKPTTTKVSRVLGRVPRASIHRSKYPRPATPSHVRDRDEEQEDIA